MDAQQAQEVEFVVIENHDAFNENIRYQRNTGTLIDQDSSGTGMLTHVPLQPGDLVRLGQEGSSRTGIVMWSVESSNKFRVQMRFV